MTKPSREAILYARVMQGLEKAVREVQIDTAVKMSAAMGEWAEGIGTPLHERILLIETILGIRLARWIWRVVTWPYRWWRAGNETSDEVEPAP